MSLQPYTLATSLAHPSQGPQFVQVLISKVPTCARIREGWVSQAGAFLWSVDLLTPVHGRGSFPERLVRQCSGLDGRCGCAAEAASAAGGAPLAGGTGKGDVLAAQGCFSEARADRSFCQAGVVAPPDSLMCEKTPCSAEVAA